MKVYIASSWKNAEACVSLACFLRSYGHEVDCFADPSTGRFSFNYCDIPNVNDMNALDMLYHPLAKEAFAEDKKWLDWCEAVVMVLPCGHSAHLEAGYAKGQGKKLFILGDFPDGQFDVMYGFADDLAIDRVYLESLLR